MKMVSSDAAASALADRLNGPDRERPIVVVTTPAGQSEPWIDAQEIERQVGDLADVYLMPTGSYTWSFTDKMPALTQVYGGAGRVYPVGHEWAANPAKSPLRFAYSRGEGARATARLIDDAMSMAAQAGLMTAAPTTKRLHLAGTVSGIVAERALVKLGRAWGNVSPAMAVPTLPIDRVLAAGMTVSGWLDETSAWFDIREMIQSPQKALAAYSHGDLVLVEVGEVREDTAEVFLLPSVPVRLRRADVTSNELDDLRSLLSSGEVIPARVLGTAPWWLTLLDVDDDEEPVPAASLIEGGPPWLTATEPEDLTFVPPAVVVEEEPAAETAPEPAPQPTAPKQAGAPPRLTPALLDPKRRPQPAPPVPTPTLPAAPAASAAVASMSLRISELEAEVRRLQTAEQTAQGLAQERRSLLQENATLRAQFEHQEKLLRDQRARLRKAKQAPTSAGEAPVFADRERGFRYLVTGAWARRTPLAEQLARPLPDYAVGPRFLDHLEALEGINAEKVADVVFEIVTGRADELASREVHQLREGEAGNAPTLVRPSDRATAWRASLQVNTPSARRIHYWRLPNGNVELWHVGVHDELPTP